MLKIIVAVYVLSVAVALIGSIIAIKHKDSRIKTYPVSAYVKASMTPGVNTILALVTIATIATRVFVLCYLIALYCYYSVLKMQQK